MNPRRKEAIGQVWWKLRDETTKEGHEIGLKWEKKKCKLTKLGIGHWIILSESRGSAEADGGSFPIIAASVSAIEGVIHPFWRHYPSWRCYVIEAHLWSIHKPFYSRGMRVVRECLLCGLVLWSYLGPDACRSNTSPRPVDWESTVDADMIRVSNLNENV